jgi:opacity protein-like surface antigen
LLFYGLPGVFARSEVAPRRHGRRQVDVRRLSRIALIGLATLVVPATALAQQGNGQVQVFGGLTARTDFTSLSTSPTFGGSIAVPLGDHVQIVGEGGRISDLTFAPLAALLDLTPADVRLSAYYGQAGIRVLGGSGNGVRPYGEVSAGLARLHTGVSGLGTPGTIVDAALAFTDRTQPMLGVGAGLMLQGGPVVLDLGYRYTRITGGNVVQQVLTGGNLGANQVRLGLGFRF